jgi:uncharacterized protein (TIGR02246 family)
MSLSDQDIQNIRELSDKFMESIVRQGFVDLANLYTEDAVFMPPGQVAVTGRSEIRAWMEGFPPVSEFDLVIDDVDGREDMAFVRGHFRMVLTPEAGAEPVEEWGKYLEVRKRQEDGSWPMAIDIFNPNA